LRNREVSLKDCSAKLTWIEHYPPDDPRHGLRRGGASWDMVTFRVVLSDGTQTVFDEPKWRPMRETDWQTLGLPPPETG
jgi:hypothetical protein